MPTKSYQCRVCQSQFSKKREVQEHFLSSHRIRWQCRECNRSYDTVQAFRSHIRVLHSYRSEYPACHFCPRRFRSIAERLEHENHIHTTQGTHFRLTESSLSHNLSNYRRDFLPNQVANTDDCFLQYEDEMKLIIKRELISKKVIRFSIILHSNYAKLDNDGEIVQSEIFTLRTFTKVLLYSELPRIKRHVQDFRKRLIIHEENPQMEESGWVLLFITSCIIEIGKIPLLGACSNDECKTKFNKINRNKYLLDVPIKAEKHENMCFLYSLVQGLNKLQDNNLISEKTYNYIEKYIDYSKAKFPMSISKIRYFEKRNKHLFFKINVFMYGAGNKTFPVYRSELKNVTKTINLLLIDFMDQDQCAKFHFVYIKDLNLFLSRQNSIKFICENCVLHFSTETALENHKSLCQQNKAQKIILPPFLATLKFDQFQRCFFMPVVGYLDFEAKIVPISPQEQCKLYNCLNCLNEGKLINCNHATRKLSNHLPISYSVIFVDTFDNVIYKKTESHEFNVMELCFDALFEAENHISNLVNKYKWPQLTPQQEESFQAATHCYICLTNFGDDNLKNRDHCHYLPPPINYRGALCQSCNLRGRYYTEIPVFVHNLSNYDAHFLLEGLKNIKTTKLQLRAIPTNQQKLKTLTIGKIKFIDSLQFLQASLDTLVSSLAKSDDAKKTFNLLYTSGLCKNDEEFNLLTKKGIFPYTFVTSLEKCKLTKTLPSKKHFYNDLKYEKISENDYKFATQVYETFNCKSFHDYLLLYNTLDTVLLCIVFQAFRKEIHGDFNIDPAHYLSTPMLSNDAALKFTNAEIELIRDPDMLLMVTSNIRGGLSQVSQRECVIDNYKPEGNSHLFYIDANNLYGFTFSFKLPYSNYQWLTQHELESINWRTVDPNGDVGYILEVDIEYPESLHKSHSDLPFAPEQYEVTMQDLSPYTKGKFNYACYI